MTTAADIAAAAAERVTYLAAEHAAEPWADDILYSRYARRIAQVRFFAIGDTVVGVSPTGLTATAADALDYAAQPDEGEGWIVTDTTDTIVTYYRPGSSIIAAAAPFLPDTFPPAH